MELELRKVHVRLARSEQVQREREAGMAAMNIYVMAARELKGGIGFKGRMPWPRIRYVK